MKPIVFALSALFLLSSCAKYKEKRAWKQWYGTYNLSQDIQMYDDFHGDPVSSNRLGINKYGITFTHSDGTQPSCVFTKMEVSDIPGYDFQLKFEEIRLFVFGEQSGQLASPSANTLNNNRTYYFKRVSDNEILFRINEGGQLLSQVNCTLE